MSLTPGAIKYTPRKPEDFDKPTAIYFIEAQPSDEWVVAIPTEAGEPGAVAVPTIQGHTECLDIMKTAVPPNLVNAPPPGECARFDFESRPGDGLDPVKVAQMIPRSVAPGPTEVSEATLAAMQARIRQLEESRSKSPVRPPKESSGRSMFAAHKPERFDLTKVRSLVGSPPPEIKFKPRRRQGEEPDSDPDEPPKTVEGRIMTALEKLAGNSHHRGREEYEEGDGGAACTTGGFKGIQRLRQARERYGRNPGRRWHHVSEVASRAGAESVPAYMETCTQMRRDRLTAYMTTMFCRIASDAEDGNLERVLGRCASALVFCDQWAIDGNIQLAWQMTLEPEPPVLLRHPDTPLQRAFPRSRRAQFPQQQFSQLAEDVVVENALAATKNWKEAREAAEKLQAEQ